MATIGRRMLACQFLAAILGTFSVTMPAFAQEKLIQRFDFLPTAHHLSFHLAAEKGWFKEAGLDVELQDGISSATTIQLVAAGTVDFGLANLAVAATARAKGVPVVAVGGVVRKGDVGLIISDKYNVHSLKEIADRQLVVVYEQGGFVQPFFKAFFEAGGVAMSDVNLQGRDPSIAISTYIAGQGDALITVVPTQLPKLERKGIQSTTFMFYDYGLPLPSFGLIANPRTLKERPEVVRKYLAVIEKALEYTQASEQHIREAAAAMIKARPRAGLDLEFLVRGSELQLPYMVTDATKGKPSLWQAPQDWETAVKALSRAGVIPPNSSANDFYTNDFVPRIEK
jgi:NitT/TauT family transport system substrate-binding protein